MISLIFGCIGWKEMQAWFIFYLDGYAGHLLVREWDIINTRDGKIKGQSNKSQSVVFCTYLNIAEQ